MKSVLITGGTGCIGSRFVHYWRDRHPSDNLIVIDLLTYPRNRSNVHKIADATFVQGDLSNARLIDTLLHQFSTSRRGDVEAEDHAIKSFGALDARVRANVNGTHVLLDAACLAWAGKEQVQPCNPTVSQDVRDGVSPDTLQSEQPEDRTPDFQFSSTIATPVLIVRAYRRTYDVTDAESYRSDGHGHGHFLCLETSVPLLIRDAIHTDVSSIDDSKQDVRNWLDADENCWHVENVLLSGCVGGKYSIRKDSNVTNMAIVHTLCAVLDSSDDTSVSSRNTLFNANLRERVPYSVNTRFGSSHRVKLDQESSASITTRLILYSELLKRIANYSANLSISFREGGQCSRG